MNAPNTRAARHARIVEVIRGQVVSSQTALAELLAGDGMHVTQATLSRDLEELRAVKVRGAYVIPEDNDRPLRPAGRSSENCSPLARLRERSHPLP